jgi:hypothetical protein
MRTNEPTDEMKTMPSRFVRAHEASSVVVLHKIPPQSNDALIKATTVSTTPFDDFRMGVDHPEDILPTRSLLGKRSPLVLVGAASTAAVLFAGLMSFRSGNFNLSQKMMRYRVLAQGATVGVMVATSGVAFADLGKLDQVWKNITLGGSDDEEDGKK